MNSINIFGTRMGRPAPDILGAFTGPQEPASNLTDSFAPDQPLVTLASPSDAQSNKTQLATSKVKTPQSPSSLPESGVSWIPHDRAGQEFGVGHQVASSVQQGLHGNYRALLDPQWDSTPSAIPEDTAAIRNLSDFLREATDSYTRGMRIVGPESNRTMGNFDLSKMQPPAGMGPSDVDFQGKDVETFLAPPSDSFGSKLIAALENPSDGLRLGGSMVGIPICGPMMFFPGVVAGHLAQPFTGSVW